MAQVIQTLCDVHLHQDPEVHTAGRTFVVVVNGRARAMEMCPDCEQELLSPLQALLVEHGRKEIFQRTQRRWPMESQATSTTALDGTGFRSATPTAS